MKTDKDGFFPALCFHPVGLNFAVIIIIITGISLSTVYGRHSFLLKIWPLFDEITKIIKKESLTTVMHITAFH